MATRLAARLPRTSDWQSLSASDRAAWQLLGWTAESWNGRAPSPITALQTWNELSPAQQAAAQHGLGWSANAWDAHLDSDAHDLVLSQPTSGGAPTPAVSSSSSDGLAAGVARAGWNMAKLVAPLAGKALSSSRHPLGALLGHAIGSAPSLYESAGGRVPVIGVETCVYLDDSGSMAQSQVRALAFTRYCHCQ